MWTYRARLDRIIDADTVDLDIDLGFRHFIAGHRVRVAGIDAPEVRGPERPDGLAATAFAADWFGQAPDTEWPLIVTTAKAGKYGRWLGTIWHNQPGPGPSLNDALLAAGHADPYT